MANPALSREVALRIGLAAKALSQVSPKDLLLVLMKTLGDTLTENKLRGVTEDDLRAALEGMGGKEDTEDSAISGDAIKQAVRYLQGEEKDLPEMPEVQDYKDGDMPGSIRVAIASTTSGKIDGHFGSCPHYLIYQLSSDEYRLIDIRSSKGAEKTEDRNVFRVNLVNDCQVIFFQSIGGPAAAKVVRAGIYPMKKPEGGTVQETLEELQQVMKGTPPPWLAKAMGKDSSKELKFTDEDDQ